MILYGVIGGLAYSLSGLAAKDNREAFNIKKFTPTLVISIIVGGVAGFTGQDYGLVASSSLGAGITAIVQKLITALFKLKSE